MGSILDLFSPSMPPVPAVLSLPRPTTLHLVYRKECDTSICILIFLLSLSFSHGYIPFFFAGVCEENVFILLQMHLLYRHVYYLWLKRQYFLYLIPKISLTLFVLRRVQVFLHEKRNPVIYSFILKVLSGIQRHHIFPLPLFLFLLLFIFQVFLIPCMTPSSYKFFLDLCPWLLSSWI